MSKIVDMRGKLKVVLCGTASLVAVILALWGTWSLAYHRGFNDGYFRGGRDEFLRWKQEATRTDASWDGMRDMREQSTIVHASPWPGSVSVNAWSADFSATGTVGVSAGGAPTK